MDRSSFIRLGLIGVSAGIILPACQSKESDVSEASVDPKAGGVYYTAEAPGRWSDKIGGHLPKIEVQKGDGNTAAIRVINIHPMDKYVHYIVKHQLLDSNFNYIDEKMFDPLADREPISEFELTDYSGTLYALSFCNIHDVWLNSVEV